MNLSKNQLTLGIEIKKKKNKKGKNRIVFQVPLQSRHYGHFFHFLRQNKINKAFSVLSKYLRLVPRSQVLPFRTSSYEPQQTVYMQVLIFVSFCHDMTNVRK